jgi:hypothetical protein
MQVCERNCWFQKGGATAHMANGTSENLREFFGDYICQNVGAFERVCDRQTSHIIISGTKLLSVHFKDRLGTEMSEF